MSFSVLLWNASIQLYRSSQILADFLHSLNRLSGICVPSLSNSLWSTANVNQERSTPTNLFLSKPWGQKETQAIQDAHSLCLSPSNLELYENGPSIFADRTVTFLLFVLVALLRLFSRHLSIITDMLHLLQMLLQPNDVQRCVVRLAIGVNAHAPNVPSDWHVASSIAQRLATEMKMYTRWIEQVLKLLLQNSPEGSTVLFPWFCNKSKWVT